MTDFSGFFSVREVADSGEAIVTPPPPSLFPETGLVRYYDAETLLPIADSLGGTPLTLEPTLFANAGSDSLTPGINGNGLAISSPWGGFGGAPLRAADTSFSLSFWYKQPVYVPGTGALCGDLRNPNDSLGSLTIFSDLTQALSLKLRSNNTWVTQLGTTLVLGNNNWHNIVVVHQKSTKDTKFYVDNILQFNINNGFDLHLSTQKFVWNTNYQNTGQSNCAFDELAIWNVALTPAQVATLWNNGAGTFY